MDDQNQTNNPLDQGAVPSMPLDITPQTPPAPTPEPLAPPTTTFTTTVSTPTEPAAPAPETTPVAPWETPVTSTPVETPAMPTPTPMPSEPEVTPQPETKTTFTTTVSMPTPTPSEPIAAPVEPEMPKGKPKSRLLPIIGGVVALLLVVGVAGAAYYVSNQLSNRQAVAPNAPTSKPAASACTPGTCCSGGGMCVYSSVTRSVSCGAPGKECPTATPAPTSTPKPTSTPAPTTPPAPSGCTAGTVGKCGSAGGCGPYDFMCTLQGSHYTCIQNASCGSQTPSGCYAGTVGKCGAAGGCASTQMCSLSGSHYTCLDNKNCGGSVGFTCGTNCPSGCTQDGCANCDAGCNSEGATACVGGTTRICHLWGGKCTGGYYADTGGACGGGSCTADGTDQATSCAYVNNIGSTDPAGSSCDSTNWTNKSCTTYTYKCGTRCYQGSCGASACGRTTASCSANADTPQSNSITFSKAGTVIPFMKNDTPSTTGTGYAGTITLSMAGAADINIAINQTGAAVQLSPFTVQAGTYTIKVKLTEDTNNSYGWILNQGSTCGPIKNPGAAITADSKPTGKCGDAVSISALQTLANSTADVSGITAGSVSATTQCWADEKVGDATQDYDFNDFALVFGYEKASPVPNCSNITGPTTLTVNSAGTYTATYSQSASKGLTGGSIFYSNVVNGVDSKDMHELFSGVQPVTDGKTLSTVFTPTAVGQYWIRCRAWNDGIAECRPPANVDAPPRFACAGPNYEMLVTVTAAPSVGACLNLNIYKKVGANEYGTTALTPAELKALTVGDTLRLEWSGALSVRGRVRVTVSTSPTNSTVGEWLPGTAVDTGSTGGKAKFFRYDGYQITVPGQYNFEAQVSNLATL